ncbi:putative diphthamide biosynthesis protein [Thermochaetoides thermophila DSM 1495]|uniref:2-(3-amino-3-carboxypropyl)histidine synthase subunit 2 n=1 Tax=Chaetomium thermophilum (strain DSM 1495 / CBS 144.50 / IMI 039719) TaxID=759272 RepID=G0S2M3_CHATD|nr:putative diphthamide biosynthesis protein [Thermochaetoides thermophila DSM 1495]EGS22256.1 putative diphthamide biosynthesis protein [Thermochaetoides thermophila DSM 1495]
MTAGELSVAPILSTPAENLFEYSVATAENDAQIPPRSDDELCDIYEIARTAKEIREGKWRRIALQFPDSMLKDAPRVAQLLGQELASLPKPADHDQSIPPERIHILADTSYSSCCVDEIAAEHVHADVVVHYGRSCLSPTCRLPVIYVFTHHQLDHDQVLSAFELQYPDKEACVVLMADVTYQDHVPSLAAALHARGYINLLSTAIIHDPTGTIPNRKLVSPDPSGDSNALAQPTVNLQSYSVFHISSPPTALLLALSSRVQSLHIYPTSTSTSTISPDAAPRLLGRRYARVLTLASAGVIGILVNTLSVANYLTAVDKIRKQIAAAGKKSYTVVVGKLNAAKLANFAEIEGWVVIGCWESALVEEDGPMGASGGLFTPVVTPFELEVALTPDDKRVWGGEWWGGIEKLGKAESENDSVEDGQADKVDEDEDESVPPEFDLRTGKLITTSRPMREKTVKSAKGIREQSVEEGSQIGGSSSALTLRAKGDVTRVNGVISPGAEYLRSQRTWQGLGSDFTPDEESTVVEEGRSGVARGYTVGPNKERR